LRASYGDVWVYTVGMVTLVLGLIVGILLTVAGVLLFGEDY
jgi:hypothetical protein